MKMIKLAVAALGLFLSASVLSEAHAAIPASIGSVFPNDDIKDLTGTLVQQNEGIPDPDNRDHCVPLNRPVAGVHGKLLGYQTVNVCH